MVRRINNDLTFMVVRDHSSTIQVVISGETEGSAKDVPLESVVSVLGTVARRPAPLCNPDMQTGEFELHGTKITVLNPSTHLAFNPNFTPLPDEDFRLAHRFVDLRREVLQKNLRFRAKANQLIRNHLTELDFVEIETPILFRSTPEGAREFLVNSDRIMHGSAFALPQSPQQFKQMLMAAGFDRYFQVARCFRDEDLRADRQPEFTQLDLEMSFVTAEQVMGTVEGLVGGLWSTFLGRRLDPFPCITYAEALARYGSDKPDLRYPYMINTEDSTGDLRVESISLSRDPSDDTEFNLSDFTPADLSFLNNFNPIPTASGIRIVSQRSIRDHTGSTVLGKIRAHLIKCLERSGRAKPMIDYSFLWVRDFPLLAARGTEDAHLTPAGKFTSMHHPFTAPHPEDMELLQTDPLRVRGQHYDLVLNGSEIAGGSVRIHSAPFQERILREIMQLPDSHLASFEHLLNALRAGCPPHGGLALGLDRVYAIMCNATSIRDVIAFPKNSAGFDLCVRAPAIINSQSP